MSTLAQLIDLAQRRFDLLTRRESLRAILPVLKAAAEDLDARLARVQPGSYSERVAREMRLQVYAVVDQLAKRMGVALDDLTREIVGQSAAAVVQELALAQAAAQAAAGAGALAPVVPVREVAVLAGAIAGDRSLLDRFHLRQRSVIRNYGADIVRAMETEIAAGLATGAGPHELTTRLQGKLPGAFRGSYWRAERIARTEAANAYNRTHVESAQRMGAMMPDVLVRWVEFVGDDGQALDNRVARDSMAMHGQLRRPGQPFWDPVNARSVSHPPNRPNDRARLVTWRASWGKPPGVWPTDPESQAAWDDAVAALNALTRRAA